MCIGNSPARYTPTCRHGWVSSLRPACDHEPVDEVDCVNKSIHLMYSEEGDWVGLYLDGKLVYEGYSHPTSRLLVALGLSFTEEERYLGRRRRCPPTLEEVL